MNLKRLAGAAAIAAAVGMSNLFGAGPVNAAPMPNPPSPTPLAPGGPGVHVPAEAPTADPAPGRSGGGGPHSGGGAMTGKPAP
jgi:hypothetical protein